ncbi:glycine cleavage system transcriptional repressor [Xanthomonas axonopodis Xac29-1]|nr:glycine cleavage system transcriptional repressor [Xanthomonas axonopodis Xac29-1]
MLVTARAPARAAIQPDARPEAPLTDSTPRPSPTENHLLINAYTTHPGVPPVARHSPHRRQRLQSRGRPSGHGGARRLGHRTGNRLLGFGRQARSHADPARTRGRSQAGVVSHRPQADPVQPAALHRRSDRRRQAGHPVPARRFLRPPGHHHRKPAKHPLPRHADRRGDVFGAGDDRRAGQHAHRRLAR